MSVVATSPSVKYIRGFLAMVEDFEVHDQPNSGMYTRAKGDFGAYVDALLEEERGINVRDDFVPCTHIWLVNREEDVVGVARLRHRIDTEFLAENAGHIGFAVAPSYRGRGYAHLAVAAALSDAKLRGINPVLVFTASHNRAARAAIERAGGVLEGIAHSAYWKEENCKYWIHLT